MNLPYRKKIWTEKVNNFLKKFYIERTKEGKTLEEIVKELIPIFEKRFEEISPTEKNIRKNLIRVTKNLRGDHKKKHTRYGNPTGGRERSYPRKELLI